MQVVPDADGDLHGKRVPSTEACGSVLGYIAVDESRGYDCDDNDPKTYPGAEEICSTGKDEDCDSDVDESSVWYRDEDLDGYGAQDSDVSLCSSPSFGWSKIGGDCDDSNVEVYPGAVETCGDGVDSNCNQVSLDCPSFDRRFLSDSSAKYYSGSEWQWLDQCELDERYLVVSSFTYSPDDSRSSRISFFDKSSATSRSLESLSTYIESPQSEQIFGSRILCTDINDDGEEDLIVSSPYSEGHPNQRSQKQSSVYIFHGPFSSESALLEAQTSNPIEIAATSSISGFGVSTDVSDLNGDGNLDLVVGSVGSESDCNDCGAVSIFFGPIESSRSSMQADITILGEQSLQRLGRSLSASRDINMDGFSDLIVSSPGWSTESACMVGRVDAYYGPIQEVPNSPSWSYVGQRQADSLGWRVAVGDILNEDGLEVMAASRPDNEGQCIVSSDEPKTQVVALNSSGELVESFSIGSGDYGGGIGYEIATIPDVEGDGLEEVLAVSKLMFEPYTEEIVNTFVVAYFYSSSLVQDNSVDTADIVIQAEYSPVSWRSSILKISDIMSHEPSSDLDYRITASVYSEEAGDMLQGVFSIPIKSD